MRACSFASANEPKISNFTEVQDAIRGLKVGKGPGPNGIPNRAFNHLPLSVVSLLVVLFNATFLFQYLPPAWKHACMFYILKLRKDPRMP